MKTKLNNIKRYVGGRFFALERKTKNKLVRYNAKYVSESNKYITIIDSTGTYYKMSKENVVSIKCGAFSVG